LSRDEFEQLLSELCDRPDDAALLARVESAVQSQPALAEVRDRWLGFERTFEQRLPCMCRVAWATLRARIAQATHNGLGTNT
jgi:hypothetical protein